MMKSVKVWQMDYEKARAVGVRKFTDLDLNAENLKKFETIKDMLEAIAKPIYDSLYNTERGNEEIANIIYARTNRNEEHPIGWKGHSMSVSDIVQINEDYLYCDAIGWANLNEIFQ